MRLPPYKSKNIDLLSFLYVKHKVCEKCVFSFQSAALKHSTCKREIVIYIGRQKVFVSLIKIGFIISCSASEGRPRVNWINCRKLDSRIWEKNSLSLKTISWLDTPSKLVSRLSYSVNAFNWHEHIGPDLVISVLNHSLPWHHILKQRFIMFVCFVFFTWNRAYYLFEFFIIWRQG